MIQWWSHSEVTGWHPAYTQSTERAGTCLGVGHTWPQQYWRHSESLQTSNQGLCRRCWQVYHLLWVLTVGIPGIIKGNNQVFAGDVDKCTTSYGSWQWVYLELYREIIRSLPEMLTSVPPPMGSDSGYTWNYIGKQSGLCRRCWQGHLLLEVLTQGIPGII